MKKFMVVIDSSSARDFFFVEGESITDPKVEESIISLIPGFNDGTYGDVLFDMEEDEVEYESYVIKVYEIAGEFPSNNFLSEARKFSIGESLLYKKKMEEEKEKNEKKLYEDLKKKYDGKKE